MTPALADRGATAVPEAPASMLEAQLCTLLAEPLAAPLSASARADRPGRPPVLPAAVLWLGLLVGVLRGLPCQRGIWRLLSVHGLWSLPRFPIGDQALYKRLHSLPNSAWSEFFRLVTAALCAQRDALTAQDLAPFAPCVLALDHTLLDSVLRKVKALRGLSRGDLSLLPGALACAFDVRRQLWLQVLYQAVVQDPWDDFWTFITTLPAGSLLLFDLGFFCFEWFDRVTAEGYCFVTRLRKRVTYETRHVFYDGGNAAPGEAKVWLRDTLVYLGTYRANKAAHPVRRIEITFAGTTYCYLTNVLDPEQLPGWQVAELYRRRWDIEGGFQLVKSYLGMAQLWSGHTPVLLHQVFATFIVAQVILGFRNELAARAQCDLREVSLRLLVEWVPRLGHMGYDPLTEMVRTGRVAGYIRPFRGKHWELPRPAPDEYAPPPKIGSRPPRYPNREAYLKRQQEARARKRARGDSAYRPYGRRS